MNEQSVSDKTEQLQESTVTKSCKESETISLEGILRDFWALVEVPEPEMLQGLSPEIRQSVVQHSMPASMLKIQVQLLDC